MNYNSLYQGYVVDVNDPLKLGRCRIRVPIVHGNISKEKYSLLPWAKYISPHPTGMKRTTFIIPKEGDVVWVAFQGGDKEYPVFFGSSFGIVNNVSEVPLEEEEYFDTDIIYSSGDVCVKRTKEALILNYGDSFININSDGSIIINSKTSNITCESPTKKIDLMSLDENKSSIEIIRW